MKPWYFIMDNDIIDELGALEVIKLGFNRSDWSIPITNKDLWQ